MLKAKVYITGEKTYKIDDVIDENDTKLDVNDLLERDLIEKVGKVRIDKKTDSQNTLESTIEDEVNINTNQEQEGLKNDNFNTEEVLIKQGKKKGKK